MRSIVIVDKRPIFDKESFPQTAIIGIVDGYEIVAPNLAQDETFCCLEPWPPKLKSTAESQTLTLVELLEKFSKGYTIVLSVKDEASAKLPIEFVKLMQTKGSHIDQLAYRGSYLAIIHDNELLNELLDNYSEVTLELTLPNGYLAHIYSAGQPFGNDSEITINGWNYSLNQRGINITVFSDSTGAIRRYSFDTFNDSPAISQAS